MLVRILIGAAGVLVLFIVVVATRRATYHVERKLEVAAPADLVFGILDDLRRFVGVWVLFGEPFEKSDPDLKLTFEGPASGAGQSYSWTGRKAGQGKLAIEESDPGKKVRMKLEFVKPMASTATYALTVAGTPAGSLVTWSMEGKHNFIGKAFGVFMDMDRMLGGDLEKGLARLKAVAEEKRA